jgi:hypothetical protein
MQMKASTGGLQVAEFSLGDFDPGPGLAAIGTWRNDDTGILRG